MSDSTGRRASSDWLLDEHEADVLDLVMRACETVERELYEEFCELERKREDDSFGQHNAAARCFAQRNAVRQVVDRLRAAISARVSNA